MKIEIQKKKSSGNGHIGLGMRIKPVSRWIILVDGKIQYEQYTAKKQALLAVSKIVSFAVRSNMAKKVEVSI
ncbi:unnamed protein product [marine sediment metagenome]|uniref:Uncharacterized protein n=1 Tax=marine sediment metagenome TaxID=412755 RepID=X0RMS9_9ZZZZ